jgi:hypothetical protein
MVRVVSVAKRVQVVRAAGLGAGAGEALAAERLHADHRADLVAVDVDVADLRPRDLLMVSSMREWMPRSGRSRWH